MTTEDLNKIITPFGRWKEHPTPEEEEAAKQALTELSEKLPEVPISSEYKFGHYGVHTGYLIGLERIFFEMQNGRYRNACAETTKYLQENHIDQPRVLNGLVLLLREMLKDGSN